MATLNLKGGNIMAHITNVNINTDKIDRDRRILSLSDFHLTEDKGFGMPVMLFLILACSLPGFVYTVILDRRYTAKLKLEQ